MQAPEMNPQPINLLHFLVGLTVVTLGGMASAAGVVFLFFRT